MRNWILVLTLLALSSSAFAQGTVTDTVRPGVSNAKSYTFVPLQSGQFLATLSWDNAASTLAMVVTCGNTNPQTFGMAGGSLDRFGRLESGLVGGQQCLISVASFDILASYRLNFQFTSADPFRTSMLSLREVAPANAGPIDGRLVEHAERALTALADSRR